MSRKHLLDAARLIVVAGFSLGTLNACGKSQGPFLMGQLCIHDEQGVANFKRLMQSIASDHNMRYIDSSQSTQESLKAMGATGEKMHASGGLIYIGLEAKDGWGLSAGNMGLNNFDVAFGISQSDRPEVASRFADSVLKQLEQQWQVKILPPKTGAFPDPNCLSPGEAARPRDP
jgi:hypothetical protein